MGIFYHPPQPPTASASGTPPEPHVPIGTQGNQPPRYTTALMLVAVLASWPADLEPRLSRPNDQQQKIAPLTLTYGQQPPRVGTSWPTVYQTIGGQWPADLEPRPPLQTELRPQTIALTLIYGQQPPRIGTSRQTGTQVTARSWPLDLEPRLDLPNNRQQAIAPLTLRYGDPPPSVGASAIDEALIIGAWPLDLEPRLGPPNQQQQHIAPLTLVYGDAPPRLGTSVPTRALIAVTAWPVDLEPRLGAPNNARVAITPLTLVYGSQPTPKAAIRPADWLAITAPVPDWSAQAAPKWTAWLAPPSFVPPRAFPYGLVLASWPADLEPRLSGIILLPRRSVVAPLTPPSLVITVRGPAVILVHGRLAIRLSDFIYEWIA